jgi:hypothetical protein
MSVFDPSYILLQYICQEVCSGGHAYHKPCCQEQTSRACCVNIEALHLVCQVWCPCVCLHLRWMCVHALWMMLWA